MTRAALALPLLLLAPLPAALAADADPLPDAYEALLCGFPQIAGVLRSLPETAGRCPSSSDYASPVLSPTACPECSTSGTLPFPDRPLSPAADVPPVLLPPQAIPSLRPVPSTPLIPVPLAGVWGYPSGKDYCVFFYKAGGDPTGPSHTLCVNVGPAAASAAGNRGPHHLLYVGSVSIPGTPGVPAGALGETPAPHVPATSYDLDVSYRWVEAKLDRRASLDGTGVWDPVDLLDANEIQWWVATAHKTTLDLRIVLKGDGAPLAPPIEVHVPYAGQIAAALFKATAQVEAPKV